MKAWLLRSFVEQVWPSACGSFDPVPQRELATFYQRCSLLVLPSLNDVYPNVVLEAMACGRPCVVTSSVGAAELVVDGESGFTVPPGDPEALAERLSAALAMSRRRARRLVHAAAESSSGCASAVVAAEPSRRSGEAHDPPRLLVWGDATETRRSLIPHTGSGGVNRPHSDGRAAR